MDKASAGREERRACNLIWNVAQDYSLHPLYMSFDSNGNADVYFNSILGAVYRFYDISKVESLLDAFHGKSEEQLYENLFLLGLENSAYQRVSPERPAMESLRAEYALRVVENARAHQDQNLFECIQTAHFERVLGLPSRLNAYERKLLDAVEFPGAFSTDEIVFSMKQLIKDFFLSDVRPQKTSARRRSPFCFRKKQVLVQTPFASLRKTPANPGSGENTPEPGRRFLSRQQKKENEARLRAYIIDCFGLSIYGPLETAELEERLCTGNHKGCHLHITRGVLPTNPPKSLTAARIRLAAQQQGVSNRRHYQEHLRQNQAAIQRLSSRIRNAMLAHWESAAVKGRAGRLRGDKVWRNVYVHDEQIFSRQQPDPQPPFSVDLLLDGSASQMNRQEAVAVQGYLIAESLSRCRIPVRVSSFCSVQGCTVLQLYRDYCDWKKNEGILDYNALGWNRDGLAIRAVGELMEGTGYEKKLLILLSDVSPNDDQKIGVSGAVPVYQDYGGQAGIRDVAEEAARLRRKGIRVICVFTGREADLPAAHEVYGKEVARSPSMDQFAERVGLLIQEQIRNL